MLLIEEADKKACVDRLKNKKIGIVGLGYVGLPEAICFAETYQVVGYDINPKKIDALRIGEDETGEVTTEALLKTTCFFTKAEEKLISCDFIIVAVPTPLDEENKPDLSYIRKASRMVGSIMKPGAIVIYESTVYPGATEEICVPLLEEESGLKIGKDFSIGYSPERINPGDKENTFRTISKVVSGYDERTAEEIEMLYASVIEAPVFRSTSIRVAEASKVVENTQRDINIAFMNELSMLFDHIGINTYEVLAAANTKWNFLPFTPGLVGGHCISVDPYYLIDKAEQLGYSVDFIKEARKTNAAIPQFITEKMIEYATSKHIPLTKLRVNILGITFKQNVPDIRNSKTIEIVSELKKRGVQVAISDPYANKTEVFDACREPLISNNELPEADIVLLAVPHQAFQEQSSEFYLRLFQNNHGLMMDLKNMLSKDDFPTSIEWWTL